MNGMHLRCRPADEYAPWFETVLKAARLAVKVLQTLCGEARASKLSFSDIVKKLTGCAESDPTFISKKVCCRSPSVVVEVTLH